MLRVGAARGVAEAFLLSAVLSVGAYFSAGASQDSALFQILALGPMCAILCAVRTRLRAGDRSGVLGTELTTGAAFAILASAPGTAAMWVTTSSRSDILASLLVIAFFVAWNLGAFAFFRGAVYLWPRWTRLRRSRLRWEMTHTILLTEVGIAAAFILALVAYLALVNGFSGLFGQPGQLASLLPMVGILIFLTVIALAAILPLAALLSYFAARKTARRLEALVHGTSGLREGNFDVRVEVGGEDEVSELQRDFNAMADELGVAVRDLRSERDNVERLLKTQRELVASVSHELRTPVATMRGYLESALDTQAHRLPPDLRGDLEVLERETARLQRLINDLFVLSRTEAGRLPLEITPTDVAALLSRCSETVSGAAWRTGKVEVIVGSDPGMPRALADEGRLEQSVRNLVSNAIRHTPPGGIVSLNATADPHSVVVEVKDTGEGIAPEDLGHIFERFYRSDGARKLDHAGAGLGLALVRELIEAMNGSVSAESEPGFGSRFTLRLPHA